ncbi:MAG: amino acid ABC transporter substrate-binding protein [Kiloniellales bacterium]
MFAGPAGFRAATVAECALSGALALALSLGSATASFAEVGALERIRARDTLVCAVTHDLPGFAQRGDDGRWRGFDIDFCRAVAAAVLGDGGRLRITKARIDSSFALLQSGDADLLLYGTPLSLGSNAGQGVEQVAPLYFDGQAFAVRSSLVGGDLSVLDGRTLCVAADGQTGAIARETLHARGLSFHLVTLASDRAVRREFAAGKCDAISAGRRVLTVLAEGAAEQASQRILPLTVSKEPLSPTVARSDPEFLQVVRWTRNALIAAEELGVTAANRAELERDSEDPTTRRLLGLEGELGKALGLDAAWAARAIAAVGNYGEIFARHLTPLGVERGLNALRRDGGILDSPPFL